jgi:hypothetical protein
VYLALTGMTSDAATAFSGIRDAEASTTPTLPPVDAPGTGNAAFFLPLEDSDGVPTMYVLASDRIFVIEFRTSSAYPPTEPGSGPAWDALRKLAAKVIASLSTGTPAGASPTCRALVDFQLEQELHKAAQHRFNIPANTIKFLANVAGEVVVDYIPGDATACKNHLTSIVNMPGVYANGELSLGADGPDGTHYGPFVYSAPQVSWISTPGAPVVDPVVIKFSPASVDAEVNPHLSIGITGQGIRPTLQLASVQLHAIRTQVTLVSHNDSLLQVGLGPTIALEAQIAYSDAEKEVKNLEAEGVDAQTAEADVAQELAGDSSIAAEQVASEYYVADIQPAVRVLYVQLDDSLLAALEADPALVAVVSPSAGFAEDPAVPADAAITASDAAAIDTTIGADAVEAGGLEELLALLLL